MSAYSLNPNMSGFIAIFLWSMTALFLALSGPVPPFQLSAISMFMASAVIFLEQIMMRKNMKERWVRPPGDYLFVAGGIGTYVFLYYFALKTAPVFEANIINYLWPLLLVGVLHFLQHETFKLYQYLGFICGFAGCALLFVGRAEHAVFSQFQIGYAAAFVAAFSWALYSGLAKTRTYPVGFMAPVFLILGILALIPHYLFEETIWPQGYIQWFAVVGLGITRVAVLAWDHGIKHGNRALLASLSYLIPIPSFLFLYLFGFGPSSPHILLSAVIVICGIIIANWPEIYRMKRYFET